MESMVETVIQYTPEEYLERVERDNSQDDDQPPLPSTGKKYSNKTHQSRTDPDARLHRKQYEKTRLAYSDNILMDNSSRIILDVEVTEPNLHDEGQAAGKMTQRSQFITGIRPETLAGDKAYGAGPAVRSICEAGVQPHVSHPQQRGKHVEGIYRRDQFKHDKERDELIYPAGERLRRRTVHKRNSQVEYVASKSACKKCALKSACTRAPCRTVNIHLDQEYLDYAARLRETAEYRISQRCRKKIEMLFGEAKVFMGLRRERRRGHGNVSEQCLITAMVQNIKRIVAAAEQSACTPAPRCNIDPRRALQVLSSPFVSLVAMLRRANKLSWLQSQTAT